MSLQTSSKKLEALPTVCLTHKNNSFSNENRQREMVLFRCDRGKEIRRASRCTTKAARRW